MDTTATQANRRQRNSGNMVSSAINQTWALKGPIVALVLLLALLPLAMSELKYVRCAYVVIVMAGLWLTEAIPIPATALLPIFMFPLCGVVPAKDIAKTYLNDTSLLFLGGLILAVAVEEWGLHKRLALGVLRIVGSDPKFVMLGLMLPTWFLSMWISNTATASMMIPIANAVGYQMGSVREENEDDPTFKDTNAPKVQQSKAKPSAPVAEKYTYLDPDGDSPNQVQLENAMYSRPELRAVVDNGQEAVNMETYPPDQTVPVSASPANKVNASEDQPEVDRAQSPQLALLCKGLSLCIAYGCNIGGIATLTGTPPNLVFKGQADIFFNKRYENLSMEEVGSGITFANWMGMALPMSAIVLLLGWILLMVMFLRGRICQKISPAQKEGVRKVVMNEWKALGPMTMAEIEVLVLFVIVAVLWISRDPKESPGWGSLFLKGYASDATVVMLVSALLFLLPAKVPRVFCLRREEHQHDPYYVPLLTWEQVHRKLPWGVIVLLGGGFALAFASEKSGLSMWLGDQLTQLKSLEPWTLNLILCLVVAMATEITSNTATSTLLMPIMAQISINVGVNPLYLMASTAMATSFAFMLPVATPPNAIVFSYGHLKVIDMAFVGVFMNIIAVLILTLAVNTWGAAIFDFFTLPIIFSKNFNITKTA
ncbi:hypothetical protein ACOMHN_024925 [Nucella lapillus]